MSSITQWYLLQCKPNQQARALLHLRRQNIECFSPSHPIKHLCKGKVEIKIEALFPGYLFINLNEDSNWRAIRATRGVSRVVSFTGAPYLVPEKLIQALKQRTEQQIKPVALFQQGERVTITEGCFKHIEAIVKSVKPDERIIVLMTLLQTEQALELSPNQLAKAS